jgi:hypothetical protein
VSVFVPTWIIATARIRVKGDEADPDIPRRGRTPDLPIL